MLPMESIVNATEPLAAPHFESRLRLAGVVIRAVTFALLVLPTGLVGLVGPLHHAVVTLDINLATTFVTEPAAVDFY
jgi:hypothetical protein